MFFDDMLLYILQAPGEVIESGVALLVEHMDAIGFTEYASTLHYENPMVQKVLRARHPELFVVKRSKTGCPKCGNEALNVMEGDLKIQWCPQCNWGKVMPYGPEIDMSKVR